MRRLIKPRLECIEAARSCQGLMRIGLSPGHSMGGGLAAEVAGTHAALVRAVVLLDPVNYALASANVPWTGLAAKAAPPQSRLFSPALHQKAICKLAVDLWSRQRLLRETDHTAVVRSSEVVAMQASLPMPIDIQVASEKRRSCQRGQWNLVTQCHTGRCAGTASRSQCCEPACDAWTATAATRRQTASRRCVR